MNENSGEDCNTVEQDSQCTLRSDELPTHLNHDNYTIPRTVSMHLIEISACGILCFTISPVKAYKFLQITSLDGLSQLVMPVLHEESSHSQYVGM